MMKRSEINKILKENISFAKKRGVCFPKFASWNLDDWSNLDEKYQEIVNNMLGWDVTDFGSNDFDKYGLVAFTFRNGNYDHSNVYPKPYCEKILFLEEGQELPYHFHKLKEEDTINRGGGNLLIKVWNATDNEEFDKEKKVTIVKDGEKLVVPAGSVIRLEPGESLTVTQHIYHKWNVEPDTGKVMAWEVSRTNNDNMDNRFYKSIPRIPYIEEDEKPFRLLFGDYPKWSKILNFKFAPYTNK